MTKGVRNILKKDLKKYEFLVNETEGETQEIYQRVVDCFEEILEE